MRFQTQEAVNNIWFTACVLHNMILSHDGLDRRWENVQWDKDEGKFTDEGEEQSVLADKNPRVVVPINTDHTLDGTHLAGNSLPEQEAGFADLRRQLVAHYAVARAKRELVWF